MRSLGIILFVSLQYLLGYGQAFNPISTVSEHLNLAEYYQRMLFIDSATYHANQAMVLFRADRKSIDSTLTSRVYATYGNCMRNGGDYHKEINMAKFDPEPRCRFLKAFLDTALSYSTSNAQRANIHFKIGTMYSDCVAQYGKDRLPVRLKLSEQSISHLNKSLELDNSKSATIYSLIGLNYQYTLQYERAERSYLNGLDDVTNNEEYFALCNWRGNNLENWYSETNDISLLFRADSIYHRSAEIWRDNIDANSHDGINDAYQVSSIGRLVSNSLQLYHLTNDTHYLNDAFTWSELSKYPTFPANRAEIEDVQRILDDSTAFVQYVFIPRPQRHIAFLIFKNAVEVVEIESFISMNTERLNYLYGCKDIYTFKKWSNLFYTGYFELVDSTLSTKQISRVIISNSDKCSMLNLDVLISDTSENKWQSLPYMFHRYKFSYALSARSFVEANSNPNRPENEIGITIGNYDNETELRFSKKLAGNISKKFATQKTDVLSNLLNHGISLLLFHGNSSYTERSAELLVSSNDTLSVNRVFDMELDNDLVMVSACNTNTSRQFYGEGATGSFTKALRYAGVKSTLTTSWWIDEKTNAFITERFIHYLGQETDKSVALWKAKNDYWKQCSSDEAFKPLYWASSVLTGNIQPVELKKPNWFEVNWYWVATFAVLLLLGIVYLKSFSSNRRPA